MNTVHNDSISNHVYFTLIRETIFDRKSTHHHGVVLDFVCVILALSNSSCQKSLQICKNNHCSSVQNPRYPAELISERNKQTKKPEIPSEVKNFLEITCTLYICKIFYNVMILP